MTPKADGFESNRSQGPPWAVTEPRRLSGGIALCCYSFRAPGAPIQPA
jgi:hypothetical protein